MWNIVKIADVKDRIGETVRLMRKSRNLTQEQLAAQLSLSRLTIVKLESGANFKIDTLLLIFQYFDELATLNDFFLERRSALESVKSLY